MLISIDSHLPISTHTYRRRVNNIHKYWIRNINKNAN